MTMANTKAKVTINDVARYANVSVATVSRVLNRTGAVRIDTQNKVIERLPFWDIPIPSWKSRVYSSHPLMHRPANTKGKSY